MPVIPILPSDSSLAVGYKIELVGRVVAQEAALADLTKWRNYYAGNHDLLLSDDQQAFLAGVIDPDTTDWPIDNKCRKVVDKVRSRLNVIGWRDARGQELRLADVEDQTALGLSPLEAVVTWWTAEDMDRWEGEIYKAALRDEEAYLLVYHDGQRPRFSVAYRWDGATGIRVYYDDPAARQGAFAAVKSWSVADPINVGATGVRRATVYTRSAVYKFAQFVNDRQRQYYNVVGPQTDDGYWPIQDQGDATWPLPWLDRDGSPLGLAIIPFISPRGSLIKNVIGLNNALNKTNLDLLATSDQQGFGLIAVQYDRLPPKTTSDGTEVDPAADGLGLRPGRALETTGTVSKLPADDMKGLLDYARHLTISVASNSDIPLHEFVPTTQEVPSGAALVMMDSSLAKQADECTVWFGAAWRKAMLLAQKLDRLYGQFTDEPASLSPIWQGTAIQNMAGEQERATAEAAEVKALVDAGVPLGIVLKRHGWSDQELAEVEAARQQEQAMAEASLASALTTQQRNFDQNQGGGTQ